MAAPESKLSSEKLEGQDATSHVFETNSDSASDFENVVIGVGAPTEKVSPLGYHVDWISVVFLVSGHPIADLA